MAACPTCATPLRPEEASCPRCGQAVAVQAPPAVPPLGLPDAVRLPLSPRQIAVRVATALLGLLLLGCTLLLVIGSVPDPIALWLSISAAVVPALLYSLLILSIDRFEREPWPMILGAFGWGAVIAALFSALIGLVTGEVLSAAYGEAAGNLLSIGLGAPFIEETFKGLALLGLLLMFRAEFDNVLDGLVYGALIGIGFAMTENILYFGQAYLDGGLTSLGELFFVRAILGGFGHALYTGTTGAAVGWARGRHGRGILRFVVPIVGWSLAVFQHFLWNTGGIVVGLLMGVGRPLAAIVIVEATVFTLPGVLILLAIALVSGRRELAIVREQLAEEVTNGVLSPRDYATLVTHPWWRTSRAAYRQGGFARWALQQRFFQTATELAFCKYHDSQGEGQPGRAASGWTAVQEQRGRLAALSRQLALATNQATVDG